MNIRKKESLKIPKSIQKKVQRLLLFLLFSSYLFLVHTLNKKQEVQLPSEQAKLVFYSNQTGDDLRGTLVEAINQAKHSVVLTIFSLSDNEVIAALKKKADEGVEVKIIQDSVATGHISYKLGTHVKVQKRRYKGLMHTKLLIIDHESLWLGSTNFTRESLDLHANLLVGILSPSLAKECEKKVEAMFEDVPCKASEIHLQGPPSIDFYFLPDQGPKALEKLIQTIKSAKKTVRVAMYTFTHQKLSLALIDAKNRGVDVEVVFDLDSSKQTSQHIFTELKNADIPCRIHAKEGLLHHKLLIVDDETCALGSLNWTKAAFSSNDDILVFISPLVGTQKEKIKTIWEKIRHESKPALSTKNEKNQNRKYKNLN